VPQDKAQAAQLYRQAAEQGHAGAQYSLGSCYEQGEGGVPQDKAQAAQLYR
jgi:TPR repeat protein